MNTTINLVEKFKELPVVDELENSEVDRLLQEQDVDHVVKQLKEAGFEKKAEMVKENSERRKGMAVFNGVAICDRPFSTDQIGEVCRNYLLIAAPISDYVAEVPLDVVKKINTLKGRLKKNFKTSRLIVVAPSESFKLTPKQIDPLLFYHFADGMFMLLHKWGSDISLTRRIKCFFKSSKMHSWNRIPSYQTFQFGSSNNESMAGIYERYVAQMLGQNRLF